MASTASPADTGGSPSMTWQDELASLVSDTGIRYSASDAGSGAVPPPAGTAESFYAYDEASRSEESLKDQVKGFLKASGEMMVELGRGVRDILQQSLEGTEDFYVVKKVRGPVRVLGGKLGFLNEYLPEDRDPVHSWSVVISVFLIAISGKFQPLNFDDVITVKCVNLDDVFTAECS